MFNTPILDIAIGLVFIFLLYSLLATSIKEAIASALSLRAKMLWKGIVIGMLSDTEEKSMGKRIGVSLNRFSDSVVALVSGKKRKADAEMKIGDYFYDHPIIKNYGSGSVYRLPAYIPTSNFSTVLIDVLKKDFERKKPDILNYKAVVEAQPIANIERDLNNAGDAIKINELFKYYAAHFDGMYNLKKDFNEIIASESQRASLKNIDMKSADQEDRLLFHSVNWNHLDKAPDPVIVMLMRYYKYADPSKNIVTRQNLAKIIKPGDLNIQLETFRILHLHFQDSIYSIEQFGKKLESWFDDSMDRVSGWYKRKVQYVLFIIGFVLAMFFNVDTIQIGQRLSRDKGLRDALVKNAIAYVDTAKTHADANKKVATADTSMDGKIQAVNVIAKDVEKNNDLLAIGWDNYGGAKSVCCKIAYVFSETFTLRKLCSFLILAFAVSLGAPFWFDMLSKIVSIRGTGKKETTASDDINKKAPIAKIAPTTDPKPVNINVNPQNSQEAVG